MRCRLAVEKTERPRRRRRRRNLTYWLLLDWKSILSF